MTRLMVEGDLAEYIRDSAIITRRSTTFDDGRIKIKMRRDVTDMATHLSVSELYIPGAAYRRGSDLVQLIRGLVERCVRDGSRLRLVGVYNKALIKRLEGSALSDVTSSDIGGRAFATLDIPRIADFLGNRIEKEAGTRLRDRPWP